jgi:hypothetical protein
MPFSPLCTISLTENWQLTPITTANYFRLKYDANFGFGNVILAQAQVSQSGLELLGTFRFSLKGQAADIAQLEVPQIFDPALRCLAIRGIGPRNQPGKILTLTIEENHMILNPSGGVQTSREKKTDFLPSDNASREMVPANADRNGGIIFNKTTKPLWIGFGVNAEKSSPHKILANGQMDITAGYTGTINGIFESADVTPGSKAIVMEMVA